MPRTPLGGIPIHCEGCDHWWLRWPEQPCRFCGSQRVTVSEVEWDIFGEGFSDDTPDQEPLPSRERTWACRDCNKSWVEQIGLRHSDDIGLGWTDEKLWSLRDEELREKAGYWGLMATGLPRDELIREMLEYQYRPWTQELLDRAAFDAVVAVAADYKVPVRDRSRAQLTKSILAAQAADE